ncbi:hypothetical protein Acsp02_34330 [Actinoplanes sp. NBRC 103695]|nr:hypothetical protein Acsp02_34330 [Actinoplanes sp. NBRC 103695]
MVGPGTQWLASTVFRPKYRAELPPSARVVARSAQPGGTAPSATTVVSGYHREWRLPPSSPATTASGGYHREWAPRPPGNPARPRARQPGPTRARQPSPTPPLAQAPAAGADAGKTRQREPLPDLHREKSLVT